MYCDEPELLNDEKSKNVNQEEMQYLNLIKECIKDGVFQDDRTGTGTKSLFGRQMRFSLKDNSFPLLTTKRVAFRVVLEELLFFIKGKTDNKLLKAKNVNIWNGNSTKEYMEKYGIQREEDDLGPVYGFQWRHYGAEYKTCKDSYEGLGIDQLANVIEEIKKNPTSRRLIVTAWNPAQLKEMVLPPCHTLFHFRVSGNKLDCLLYQRSGDVGLGIPFNIASYSLLLIIVARLTGLIPNEFIHTIGDTHVYSNHIEQLTVQAKRAPTKFPTLKLREKEYTCLEDFESDDFILEDYAPQGTIKMQMAI
ncbi:thymidylate synthase [Enteropsectra breve]|nr:thymidylate synthase [Enteropsectra breve]